MKRLNFYFVVFALIAIVFNSCKKDDDSSPSSSGSFTVKGKTWNTPNGYLASNAPTFSIMLIDDSQQGDNYTGKEYAGITLYLTSSSNTELVSGTYTFGTSDKAMTFDTDVESFDAANTNCIIDTDGDPEPYQIKAGSLTISKNGNVYDISYSITQVDNAIVTGSYKGELKTMPWF